MSNKNELELLIAEERPVGDFLFDEEKQCFTTDVEVIYELVEIYENTYSSGEFICFDGYEYSLGEHEKKIRTGTLQDVEEQLAQEYNEENEFGKYPVRYTNFQIKIVKRYNGMEPL